MDSCSLLHPADYVWLRESDLARPEPAPPGADGVLAVYLGRHAGPETTVRTVLVERRDGFAPLARRIHLHGEADEGWDWGWRGGAPLDTALNLLLCFVHPRAAWRLQWAFCEAFLLPLAPAGGTLAGERVRGWLAAHAWIGRQSPWPMDPGAAERELADERARSRTLLPPARAARVAALVGAAPGDRTEADPRTDDGPGPWARAAAVLGGAPPEQRWATLALLAGHLPPPGSPARDAWQRAASPATPGLPDPGTVTEVAAVWSRLVGRTARERAALLAAAIREEAGRGSRAWAQVPRLALPLGGAVPDALRGELSAAGDPVAIAATLHALGELLADDPALAARAAALGLSAEVLAGLSRSAHAFHVHTLRLERRECEAEAASEGARVRAAAAVRLGRGRVRPPPPHSPALRRWLLAVSEDLLLELARAARGPAGALALRAAMRGAGVAFPDPPGTVAQACLWYLEERVPAVLDPEAFPVRGDGLASAQRAGGAGVRPGEPAGVRRRAPRAA